MKLAHADQLLDYLLRVRVRVRVRG